MSKNITEIGGLLQKVDDLKRIMSLYACQIESKYKNARPLEDGLSSIMENVTVPIQIMLYIKEPVDRVASH